jgi:hypothetical protein
MKQLRFDSKSDVLPLSSSVQLIYAIHTGCYKLTFRHKLRSEFNTHAACGTWTSCSVQVPRFHLLLILRYSLLWIKLGRSTGKTPLTLGDFNDVTNSVVWWLTWRRWQENYIAFKEPGMLLLLFTKSRQWNLTSAISIQLPPSHSYLSKIYEGVSKSLRTGRLERELQNCIALYH